MRSGGIRMEPAPQGSDVFFLLIGAVLVFAMHGGFAFLEVGTVRHKNQVNALVKIIVDFAISTIVYFFVGYWIAYGISFLQGADVISGGAKPFEPQGFGLVKFFFLAPSQRQSRRLFRAASRSERNSCRNVLRQLCWSASSTR